jgi:hypothetical protein
MAKYYVNLKIVILIVMFAYNGIGQIISTIKISTDTCYIGDVVKGELYVKVPESAVFEGLDFTTWKVISNKLFFRDTLVYDEFCDAEILDYGAWIVNEIDDIVPANQISLTKEQGYITFKNTIKFAIYNQGRYQLPGAHLIVKDSTVNLVDSQGPVIEVLNPDRVMASDSLQINPIKDIITEPSQWSDFLYLLWIVPILIGLWYAYKKYKSIPVKTISLENQSVVHLTPSQKAIKELDVLQQDKPWLIGNEVEYQTRLTDIIRTFIKEQYRIAATEMTTVELLPKMKSAGLTSSQINNLNQILNIADLVKFAKVHADDDIHASFLDKAYSFVKNDSNP